MFPSGVRTWFAITLICCHIPFLFVQAFLHTPRSIHAHNSIGKRDGLTSASWIWTAAPTTGNVAFMKILTTPTGKTATSATISLTAVDEFTLWVNNQAIGTSGANWKAGQAFSAGLNASANIVAVLAVNKNNAGAPAPGLLATILVTYSDGSSDTAVSDASWFVSASIPPSFPTVSDASKFGPATVLAPFGSGSWGSSVTMSSPPSNSSILSGSQWIWSTSTAASDAATGTVGFRRTLITPAGKSAQSATVLLTVDNSFTFYLNTKYVGAPPPAPAMSDFRHVQQFTVDLSATSNVFTVFASNIPNAGSTDAGPAGFVAAIHITYTDGSTADVGTDTTWLSGAFTSVPAFLALPDSALSATFALGTMGASPWGQMTAISNALPAVKVPSGPFASGIVPQAPVTVGNINAGGGAGGGASQASAASSPSSTAVSSAGNPLGSSLASAQNAESVLPLSSSATQGVSAPNSSASASNSSPNNDNTAASSSSSVSVGLIVAVVVGVLTLIAVGVALFCWRRRRRAPMRHARALSSQLFDAANNGQVVHSSAPSASQRTSMTSVQHPEMAMAPSQLAGSYNYPRPPVMVQGVYVQPPSATYQQSPPATYQQPAPFAHQPPPPVVYQQPPPVAYQSQPAPPPVTYQPQPPSVAYDNQSSSDAYGGVHPDASRSATPQPTPSDSEPHSKLARENMIWQNNAAGSSAIAPPSGTPSQMHSRGPSSVDLYGDTETIAPPSYYAQ